MSGISEDPIREELVRRDTWTTEQAAYVLGVAKSTVTRWIAAGMPARKTRDEHGRQLWIIRAKDARRWCYDPDRATRGGKRDSATVI